MQTFPHSLPVERDQPLADPRNMDSSAALRLAGMIGILTAYAVGVADVALLYSPEGGYGSGSYAYLRGVLGFVGP